jgi:hypothetical protein
MKPGIFHAAGIPGSNNFAMNLYNPPKTLWPAEHGGKKVPAGAPLFYHDLRTLW